MVSDDLVEGPNREEERLLDPPIGTRASSHSVCKLLHIGRSEVQEGHKVVRLDLFLLLRFVLTY